MKKLLLSIWLIAAGGWAMAHPVNMQTAQKAAQHFMESKTGQDALRLDLIKTYGTEEQAALYIFEPNQGKGFVIISGDDAVSPVLGYSTKNTFAPATSTISPELDYWLNGYTSQIEAVIKNNVQADAETAADWNNLLSQNNTGRSAQRPTGVSPMLETSWDQLPYYNVLCPGITPGQGNPSPNAPTGCVATAMAQIMKYWENPTTGSGTHSYNSSLGGTLSADFGNTTYDWANMPNTLNSNSTQAQVNAIATLMYHCGIAVDMDYEPDGSGALVVSYQPYYNDANAEDAFKTYFGYSATLHGEERSDYNTTTWINMLKTELDNGNPILYAGFGQVGGHAFDFDGYDNSDNFHINWGWSGYGNGYYSVDDLAPTFVGTGGGVGNFNYGQMALFGIVPAGVHLKLNSAYTASADSIIYNTAYTVSTTIKNSGNTNFNNGLLILMAVPAAGNTMVQQVLLDSLRTSIGAHSDYNYSFTTQGRADLMPGTYKLVYDYVIDGDTGINTVGDGITQNGSQLLTVLPSPPTGIEQANALKNISVYPNPASSYINIEARNAGEMLQNVTLFNMQGKKIFDKANIRSESLRISADGFAKGIYFLVINTNEGTFSQKISIGK